MWRSYIHTEILTRPSVINGMFLTFELSAIAGLRRVFGKTLDRGHRDRLVRALFI